MPSKQNKHDSGMKPAELVAWRERHKYSREDLATDTGVTLRTIENYEQGVRKIPMLFTKTLKLLIKVRNLQA